MCCGQERNTGRCCSKAALQSGQGPSTSLATTCGRARASPGMLTRHRAPRAPDAQLDEGPSRRSAWQFGRLTVSQGSRFIRFRSKRAARDTDSRGGASTKSRAAPPRRLRANTCGKHSGGSYSRVGQICTPQKSMHARWWRTYSNWPRSPKVVPRQIPSGQQLSAVVTCTKHFALCRNAQGVNSGAARAAKLHALTL